MIACGPPRSDFDPVADASTSDGTDSSSSETGDSSGTETGGQPSTSTTSSEFVPQEEDLARIDPCEFWAQDCPDGEKCVPYASSGGELDDLKCVPIMGEQAAGEPCMSGGIVEATDDCDETSFCWDVMAIDGDQIGVCHVFCTGNPDEPECPTGSACAISGSAFFYFCTPTCDPIGQNCAPGTACFFTQGIFWCISATQDIPAGEPCGFINDCAAGHMCLPGESFPACDGFACCSPFCDISLGDGQCGAVPGTSCVAFFSENEALAGYEQVGVCIVP